MIMENGFASSRTDSFPAGLRVLVVDDDPTWLKILEKMLKKCSYEVTTCGLAREALRLLRDRKDGFDIVISDVNMPDMDGFKLLEHVGLEMDLPVIMMSVDGETRRVMKGVQHGACDYLLKPIRMKELKNIWQHVVRKRLNEVRDIDFFDDHNDGHYGGGDQTLIKKRKDVESEKESSDPSSSKKARVVWTIELHQKFVKAVNQIGIDSDKVGPKKILDLMNVPWLTRENVASHLQKYRLYLSRIGKGDNNNMESSFEGTKNPEFSPKGSVGLSNSIQNSSFTQHNDVTSRSQSNSELKLKSKTEARKPFKNENSDPQKADSQAAFDHSFQFDSHVSGPNPWRGEVLDLQFKPELKPLPKLKDCFNNHQMVPILQHQNLLEPAAHISHGLSVNENDGFSLIDVKPLISKQTANNVRHLDSISLLNTDRFGCVFDVRQEKKNQNQNQNLNSSRQAGIAGNSNVNGFETESINQALEAESTFGHLGEDLMFRCLQGGVGSSKDFGVDDVGFSDSNFSEVPFPPYMPKFGFEYEYPFDWEYPVVDQGLLFS